MHNVQSILLPEKKWAAFSAGQQFGTSTLVHVLLLAAFLLVPLHKASPNKDLSAIAISIVAATSPQQSGPQGAEPDATKTMKSIPVRHYTPASNALPSELPENFPRAVPVLSVNQVAAQGKVSARKSSTLSKNVGPNNRIERLECSEPVLASEDQPQEKERASLLLSSTPEISQTESGMNAGAVTALSMNGTGAPVFGSTRNENEPAEFPGGIVGDLQGPGRPGVVSSLEEKREQTTEPKYHTNFLGPYLLPYDFSSACRTLTGLDSFIQLDTKANDLFLSAESQFDRLPEEACKQYCQAIHVMNFAVPLHYRDTGANKEMARAVLRLAWCYRRLGEHDHASYYLEKVVYMLQNLQHVEPQLSAARFYLADSMIHEKRYAEAEALLKSLIAASSAPSDQFSSSQVRARLAFINFQYAEKHLAACSKTEPRESGSSFGIEYDVKSPGNLEWMNADHQPGRTARRAQ